MLRARDHEMRVVAQPQSAHGMHRWHVAVEGKAGLGKASLLEWALECIIESAA